MATDLRTGRSRHLRNDPGREPEEERVTMIRVSQGKQYFIVAFAAAPFELWDLRKLCLLRTMPKKFPPISALVWSPLHSSKGRRGSGGSREGSPALPQQEANTSGGQKPQKQSSSQVQSGKEHILLTDTVGQVKLYENMKGTMFSPGLPFYSGCRIDQRWDQNSGGGQHGLSILHILEV